MNGVAVEYSDVQKKDIRWDDVYNFTTTCGKAQNPKNLAIDILNNISELCSFDEALIYFIDGNKQICDQYLLNIDSRWSNMYIGYYSKADNQKYSCSMDLREDPGKIILQVLDWENEPSTEFISNYIHARGLKYSCGFALFDMNGNYRTVISLDRIQNKGFSRDELLHLQAVIPQLNNLHKNFYYQGFIQNIMKKTSNVAATANLTARESEIANLLCQGVTPTNISRTLYIAQSTTYKHIANIYEKLHVSSQQELLVCLLRHIDGNSFGGTASGPYSFLQQ